MNEIACSFKLVRRPLDAEELDRISLAIKGGQQVLGCTSAHNDPVWMRFGTIADSANGPLKCQRAVENVGPLQGSSFELLEEVFENAFAQFPQTQPAFRPSQ